MAEEEKRNSINPIVGKFALLYSAGRSRNVFKSVAIEMNKSAAKNKKHDIYTKKT